jgi:hypothetical protein
VLELTLQPSLLLLNCALSYSLMPSNYLIVFGFVIEYSCLHTDHDLEIRLSVSCCILKKKILPLQWLKTTFHSSMPAIERQVF